jgi:glycosyltransferase involved in cell wall biosynthesis
MVQEQRVDLVWVFPAGATLTYVTRKVICVLKTPFVVTVWDPPDYFAAHLRLNRINLRILQKDFANILLKAVRCGVASEGMKEEYENLYGTKCIIQIHGVDPRLRQAPAKGISKDGQIVIGHAGNWHGQQEWEALLSALTSVNWSIDGREVTVRVLGSHILVKTQGRTRIEYLGWRSQEETIKLLSDMDIMYLPYWFDKRFGVSVRLCFPNKLTAYLAAGRPVLFHGPEDSSPARFFRRFPAGVCCHSLEKSAIIECLHRLVNDRELYASAVQAGQRALDEELNQQVFLRRFAELIGIQEKDLPVSYKKMIEECD